MLRAALDSRLRGQDGRLCKGLHRERGAAARVAALPAKAGDSLEPESDISPLRRRPSHPYDGAMTTPTANAAAP